MSSSLKLNVVNSLLEKFSHKGLLKIYYTQLTFYSPPWKTTTTTKKKLLFLSMLKVITFKCLQYTLPLSLSIWRSHKYFFSAKKAKCTR